MNIDDFYNKYVKAKEDDIINRQKGGTKSNKKVVIIFLIGMLIFYFLCMFCEMNELGGIVIVSTFCVCIIISMKSFEKYDYIGFFKKEVLPVFFEKCFENIEYDCDAEFQPEDKKNLKGIIPKNDTYGKGIININSKEKIQVGEIHYCVNTTKYITKYITKLLLILPMHNNYNNKGFFITVKPQYTESNIRIKNRMKNRIKYGIGNRLSGIIIYPLQVILEKILGTIFDKIEEHNNIVVRSEYYNEFNQRFDMYNLSKEEIEYKEKIIEIFLAVAKKCNINYEMCFKDNKLYIIINNMGLLNEQLMSKVYDIKNDYRIVFEELNLKIKLIDEIITSLSELENYL